MITKSWKIDSMLISPQLASQTNVITQISWRLNATDNMHNSTVYGSVNLSYEEGSPFTPYEQLIEEQVVTWVKESLGPATVAAHEAAVEQQIFNLINPPLVQLANPW